MELNLLFLPLLGGYIFYTKFHGTAYSAARVDGYRIIFHAGACGLIFLILAQAISVSSIWAINSKFNVELIALYLLYASGLYIGIACLIPFFRRVIPWWPDKERISWPTTIVAAVLALLVSLEMFLISLGRFPKLNLYSLIIATLAFALPLSILFAVLRGLVEELTYEQIILRISVFATSVSLVFYAWAAYQEEASVLWNAFSPHRDSATVLIACLLGVLSPFVLNLLWPYQTASRRRHQKGKSNTLEKFFFDAAESGDLIMLTLADDKVYVCLLDWMAANPTKSDAHFQMLPLISGYRHKDTRKVTFTTYYDEIIHNYVGDPESDAGPKNSVADFVKVIPYQQILSATLFLEKVYEEFNPARRGRLQRRSGKSNKKKKPAQPEDSTVPADH